MKTIIIATAIITTFIFFQLGAKTPVNDSKQKGNTAKIEQLRAKIEQQLAQFNPDIKLKKPNPTPINGYYQIGVQNGPMLYAKADGSHFFAGDLFYLSDEGIIPATDYGVTDSKEAWQAFKKSPLFDKHIAFTGAETKAYLNVFTDYTCGYCRKLHRDIDTLNAMGIGVRYFAFPRSGQDGTEAKNMQSAWCSDNPHAAISALKSGDSIVPNDCKDDTVKQQYRVGVKLNVKGTPAIYFDDGTHISGYMSPKKFAAALNIQ